MCLTGGSFPSLADCFSIVRNVGTSACFSMKSPWHKQRKRDIQLKHAVRPSKQPPPCSLWSRCPAHLPRVGRSKPFWCVRSRHWACCVMHTTTLYLEKRQTKKSGKAALDLIADSSKDIGIHYTRRTLYCSIPSGALCTC